VGARSCEIACALGARHIAGFEQPFDLEQSRAIRFDAVAGVVSGRAQPQSFRGPIQKQPRADADDEREDQSRMQLGRAERRQRRGGGLALRILPARLLQQVNAALQGRVLLHAETLLLQHGAPTQTLAQQLLDASATPNNETCTDRLLTTLDRGLTRGVISIRRLYTRLRYVLQPAKRTVHLRFLQAEDAACHGQVATAQALYTQVAQQAPDMPYVQERLCEVCYTQGKFREALCHLRRLLKQLPDPDQPGAELAVLLGELLCQVGQYQEAGAVLAQAGTSTARDYRLWYYLGLCQLQAGTPQMAQRSFIQAVQQLNPDIAALRLAEMARVSQGRSSYT